jgi:outer membrane receptor protein involved in Fe transport
MIKMSTPSLDCPVFPLAPSRISALLSCLGLIAGLSAQSVPPPPSAPASASGAAVPEDDEVIVLDVFNINETTQTNEWVATQALTGTRTAEQMLNLPYQIQVVTSEMLQDFGMIAVVDQLSAIGGFVGEADQADPAIAASAGISGGGGKLRGFSALILRDGFRMTQPPQNINTQQVEVIKGPMSALYGAAQPGGLINYISRRPTSKARYEFSFTAGSYDRWEPSVLINTPVVPRKVFILVGAQHMSRKSDVQYVEANTTTLFGSVLYKPFRSTNITVSYETQHLDGIRQAGAPNYVVDAHLVDGTTNPVNWDTDTGYVAGIWWPWIEQGLNLSGPNEWYNRDYDRWHVQFEQGLGRNWRLKAAYQWQVKTFDQNYYNSSNLSMAHEGLAATADGRPYGGFNGYVPEVRFQDWHFPYAALVDLSGEFRTGKIHHKLLFTADIAKVELDSQAWRLPSPAQSPQYGATVPADIRYMDPRYPNYDLTSWYNPPGGGGIYDNMRSRDRDLAHVDENNSNPAHGENARVRMSSMHYTNLRLHGYSVSERMFLFGSRLILMGSLRLDRTKYQDYQITTTRNVYRQWTEGGESLRALATARHENGQSVGVQYLDGATWRTKMTTDAGGRPVPMTVPAVFSPNWVPGEEDKLTYSAGATWKILSNDKLIAFANYSTSFNPEIVVDDGIGELMPNETGKGFEAGLKFLPYGKNLVVVLSYFDIEKHNIAISNPDYRQGDGSPQYLGSGAQRVSGMDLDLTWVPVKDLTLLASASYMDSETIESANKALVGNRMTALPNKTFQARARYRLPPGLFRGFTIGADVICRSGWVRGYYRAPTSSSAGRLYEWRPGNILWGGFLRYEWKSGKKASHQLNLNCRNALDKLHTGLGATRSLGRQVNLTYKIIYR